MSNIKLLLVRFLLVLQLIVCDSSQVLRNKTGDNPYEDFKQEMSLSRRKRFVIFPEGSSLQLVFCTQTSALIPIGDIFLFGNTAALAWMLPTDPKFLTMFTEYTAIKRMDALNYVDENGKMIGRVPYQRKQFVNPVFAKRSIQDEKMTSYKEKLKIKIDKKTLHERHYRRPHLQINHIDNDSIEFHRNSRLELYEKIETLITALGRDGRQCVLYKLCEAAGLSRGQGTFLQEFLQVVFTLPKTEKYETGEQNEYDSAHTETDDCLTRYPGCHPDEVDA